MSNKLFDFGEKVSGYDVKVINEREARASAGILFVFALFSFLYAFNFRDFKFTQIFVAFFFIDFFIRVIINPRFAPSLIMGRFFVSNQVPEYVGASQKRFAWSFGLILSIIMGYLLYFEIMLPFVKIPICVLCLFLLFSESAFGICVGCKVYNFLYKDKAKYCPGGSCEIVQKEDIQKISLTQSIIAISAIIAFSYFTYNTFSNTTKSPTTMKCGVGKCGMEKCGR
jgi:hypothetical protein